MRVKKLTEIIGADFYTGVPDSQLKPFCDYLMDTYGIDKKHHIIAANEGNCAALAAGYNLATGKIPVVYMQNSGEGNIINPLDDEPQHIYQGEVTVKLMEDMDVKSFIISKDTTEDELSLAMNSFRDLLKNGKQIAFIVRKGALEYGEKVEYKNSFIMLREEIIRHIVRITGEEPIVSTTGKASRELFEIREANSQSHKYDFLTVGSMGHSSSIALGIALNKPERKIWCIDGDGAVLMHMGSIALIGANSPKNLVHIVINNGAHETVGGMPTVGSVIDIVGVAKACGYPHAVSVSGFKALDNELKAAKSRNVLSLIEVKCSIGARADLDRPTITTIENKENFAKYLSE